MSSVPVPLGSFAQRWQDFAELRLDFLDWKAIEHMTARDWLIRLGGREVFRVVWEPLLQGKFGEFADQVRRYYERLGSGR